MSLILLNIFGGVALMLWGIRMVGSGFQNAVGSRLRGFLLIATEGRLKGFAAGLGVTILLQSSTATILLLSAFVQNAIISVPTAIAIVLGADVGTTVVAQILHFNVYWLSPFLIAAGYIGHSFATDGDRQSWISRIFIGLGIVLLALTLIKAGAEPIKSAEFLPVLLQSLASDPILAIGVAAILTWVIHSSLAAVLLFASLMQIGILPLPLGLLFVLGANIGGAIVPLFITWKGGRSVRTITLSNLFMRSITALAVFLLLDTIIEGMRHYMPNNAAALLHFHTAFNVLLALIFLPFCKVFVRGMQKVMPMKSETDDANYLDDSDFNEPVAALSNARRETLKMADAIYEMLTQSIKVIENDSTVIMKSIQSSDDRVDKIYKQIKLYITELLQQDLQAPQRDSASHILNYSTYLEHIGDIIDKSLMHLAGKKIDNGYEFSEEGLNEIKSFHDLVAKNVKLAESIFTSQDRDLAQKLVNRKSEMRQLAEASAGKHYNRMTARTPKTMDSSALHLDIIRDLRQINSYATRIAYDVMHKS